MASLQRDSHPLGLNLLTTETETETLQWDMVGHQRVDHSWDGGMTLADENQPEVIRADKMENIKAAWLSC